MRIVIAGGHGKIALLLTGVLAGRGDRVAGIIRDPGQAAELRAAGSEPVVLDLEKASVDEVAAVLEGADAVVFAAGAGAGSGAERKDTVDRGAAVLVADAAERAGVRRYLMVSSMGADTASPPDTDPVFAAYLRAKGAADADLRARTALDWTILRPGRLTDDPPTGTVHLSPTTGHGSIPRPDVAATLAALLTTPTTTGLTLELVSGPTPIPVAVKNASGG
jgi:uncharacterized protein YbjT (DUF2867 family)